MDIESLNTEEQKYFDTKGVAAPAAESADTAAGNGSPMPDTGENKAATGGETDTRTVPLAALHEERERRKELQRQIEEVNRRAEERFNLIVQKLGARPGPDAASATTKPREIPDPEKDAVGAIRMTAEEVKTLSDFKRQLETQAAQGQAIQAIMGEAMRLEAEFDKATPDYRGAGEFLKASRARELAALGIDPFRMQQMLAAESVQLAQAALQQGKNPAEIVYTLAKSRGFQRQAGDQAGATNGAGEAAKLARIAKGQEAGVSLGAAAGSAPTKTGIEALLAMSDGEFAAALDGMSADQLRQHFGA